MINYTADQKTYQAPAGMTILDALLKEGVEIPHLCHDVRLNDPNKTCGLCVVKLENEDRVVRSCATVVEEGMVITTNSEELQDYRKVRMEQLLEDHNADCVAPCQSTCPAGIDIQSYLSHASNGNWLAALRTIMEKNPFPSVCGRVCPHSCESECRRNLVDEAVNINGVKRAVSDYAIAEDITADFDKREGTGKRIAVVGGGPAGLSAAFYGRLKGHEVTVFDKQEKMGGMMRYGIPDYRLPQEVLDRELKNIEDLGVKYRNKKALGMELKLSELKSDFDAVYLSVGSWQATSMGLDGENISGVWKGINFLERIAKGKKVKLGSHAVVIGGGNTAIDCARTALRLGSEKVTLLYRRTRAEMPAELDEIEEALHEGVEFKFLTSPVRFEGDDENRVCSVECVEMELREPDRSGRCGVRQIEGSNFTVDATSVLLAVGQKTDTSYLWNDMPVKLNKWGDVEVSEDSMMTSEEKVFAGGDCVTGPATVIQAVAAGRQAADLMDDYLMKGYVRKPVKTFTSSRGSLEDVPRYEFSNLAKLSRNRGSIIEEIDMDDPFAEAAAVMSVGEAKAEADRCLSCGCNERHGCMLRDEATDLGVTDRSASKAEKRYPITDDHLLIIRDTNKCISCGKCISTCKEIQGVDALDFHFKQGKLGVGTKDGRPLSESECVSCGQCVIACPCGALDYKRVTDKVYRGMDAHEVSVAFVAPAVRSVIAQHFDLKPEEATPFIAGLLKKVGFDKVYDFTFAADLTIIEETTEFLERVERGALPHLTSCCPGWVSHVEKSYPEMIPFLSSCKSPQQMMGSLVKEHLPSYMDSSIGSEDLFVVSVVPCLAKKSEAKREEFNAEGIRDVDEVLSTTELIDMAESMGWNRNNVPQMEFDKPYKRVSGAGVLFGMTGGVAEATLRMACAKEITPAMPTIEYEVVRGMEGIKMATVKVGDRDVRIAVVNGLKNAQPIIQEFMNTGRTEFDLVEVMACPGGCVSGAGHPVPKPMVRFMTVTGF